ncbi:hypothetical protein OIH30_10290 [Lactococcus petauri]|uniref:hypothetical protein n=1 Tax=Lactococcus petauri TaxID=1940789 RepID=UPI0021F1766F|nr:hypothetical protein [Lactococcus petauri]MCV5953909.1 hypothetical protein [Lactococcus petauri]
MTVPLDNDGQSVGTALNTIDSIANYMRHCRYNTTDNWLFDSFINSYANEQILINICMQPFYGIITLNNYCNFDYFHNWLINNDEILEDKSLSEIDYYQEYDLIYLLSDIFNPTVGMIWKYTTDTDYRYLTFDPVNNFYEGSLNDYIKMYPEYTNYQLVRPTAFISDKR